MGDTVLPGPLTTTPPSLPSHLSISDGSDDPCKWQVCAWPGEPDLRGDGGGGGSAAEEVPVAGGRQDAYQAGPGRGAQSYPDPAGGTDPQGQRGGSQCQEEQELKKIVSYHLPL